MNKVACAVLCALIVASSSAATPLAERQSVDFSARYAPGLEAHQAATKSYTWTLLSNRAAVDLTGYTPIMYWAPTNTPGAGYVPASCAWVDASAGVFMATFSASDLNTNGIMWYGIGASSGSVSIARQGTLRIIPDPYAAGGDPLTMQTSVTWGAWTWLGFPGVTGAVAAGDATVGVTNGVLTVGLSAGAGISAATATGIAAAVLGAYSATDAVSRATGTLALAEARAVSGRVDAVEAAFPTARVAFATSAATAAVASNLAPGVVRVWYPGGAMTSFVATADTDAARGAALTAAQSSATGARIDIGAGGYQVFAQVAFTDATIAGAGRMATRIYSDIDDADNATLFITRSTLSGVSVHQQDEDYTYGRFALRALNSFVYDCDIVNTNGEALLPNAGGYLSFKNCKFQFSAMDLDSSMYARGWHFDACYFDRVSSVAFAGLYVDNSTNIRFTACDFVNSENLEQTIFATDGSGYGLYSRCRFIPDPQGWTGRDVIGGKIGGEFVELLTNRAAYAQASGTSSGLVGVATSAILTNALPHSLGGAGTQTLAYADSPMRRGFTLYATGSVSIAFGDWPTNDSHVVSLDIYAGAHAVTLLPSSVSTNSATNYPPGSAGMTLRTSAWDTLYFQRPAYSTQAWGVVR